MPQNPKPLWKYPGGFVPLGSVTLFGEKHRLGANFGPDLSKRLAMVKTSRRLLKNVGVDRSLSSTQQTVLTMTILGDCFEVALNPSLLTDGNHPGTTHRFLDFLACNPEFALKYMTALRKAIQKPSSFEHRAIEVLRASANDRKLQDKEVAAKIGASPNVVYNARRSLHRLDRELIGDDLKPYRRNPE